MKNILLFLPLITCLTFSSCSPKKQENNGKIAVTTTIGMIADIAKNVGGDRVEVTALMGPGVDPHLYRASAGDLNRLTNADIIFYNGLHLEAAMSGVLERIGDRVKSVAVTDNIDRAKLLAPPEFSGAYDPHVWFDVKFWINATETVQNTLSQFDPAHAKNYRHRTKKYLEKLAELHSYVKSKADEIPMEDRVLVTAHDAFNYFGRAYEFEVRGLMGISTASGIGTADVRELANFIAERKIPAIFVESSVSPQSIKAVQAAVRSRGFDVKIGGELFSDAMGSAGTLEGTYIGMVRHNIDTIVSGLSGKMER